MTNYKQDDIDYQYPLPRKLFANFLMGKKEDDIHKYFSNLVSVIDEFDHITTGRAHTRQYEYNHAFLVKLIDEVLGRYELARRRTGAFDICLKYLLEFVKREDLLDKPLALTYSEFAMRIGSVNSIHSDNKSMVENLKKLRSSYPSTVHEVDVNKLKFELKRIEKVLSEIVSNYDSINDYVLSITEKIPELIIEVIKNKLMRIKQDVNAEIYGLSKHPETFNPNTTLKPDEYAKSFNNNINDKIVSNISRFRDKLNNVVNNLPDVIVLNSNQHQLRPQLIKLVNSHIETIINQSSKTNYFAKFKEEYDKHKNVA